MGIRDTGNLIVDEGLVSVYVERNKTENAGFGYSEKFAR